MIRALLYRFTATLVRYVLLPCYTRITVRGIENVPAAGPLVIAANHLNDADPLILIARIPRRIVFMAKVELFRVPLLGQLLRAFGAFPVRRNEADLSALRWATGELRQGLALGIFPEGRTSTRGARLQEAWPGAALLALRAEAPVLPVAITGSQYLQLPFFFFRIFKRYDVTVTIGAPFSLSKRNRLNGEAIRAATQTIMERISALLPPEYRGFYAQSESANRVPAPPTS